MSVPDAQNGGPPLSIVLDRVTRRGGLLFGELIVSGGQKSGLSYWFTDSSGLGLNNARGESGGVSSLTAASGPTLISGGSYVFPVDYLPASADSHRVFADLFLETLKDGMTSRVCMVWPDTGESSVTVDRPADGRSGNAPWRLTDVPVVEG